MNLTNINGAIQRTSVYADGQLLAFNTTVTLPDITPTLAELLGAGGTFEMPVYSKLDPMECTVTVSGTSGPLFDACKPGKHELQVNLPQAKVQLDGSYSTSIIKAYLTVLPKMIPGGDYAWGEVKENSVTFSVVAYKITVDGETKFDVNVLSGDFESVGSDVNAEVKPLI